MKAITVIGTSSVQAGGGKFLELLVDDVDFTWAGGLLWFADPTGRRLVDGRPLVQVKTKLGGRDLCPHHLVCLAQEQGVEKLKELLDLTAQGSPRGLSEALAHLKYTVGYVDGEKTNCTRKNLFVGRGKGARAVVQVREVPEAIPVPEESQEVKQASFEEGLSSYVKSLEARSKKSVADYLTGGQEHENG